MFIVHTEKLKGWVPGNLSVNSSLESSNVGNSAIQSVPLKVKSKLGMGTHTIQLLAWETEVVNAV